MSLFSLQDIITCLSGIMILIVLILAMEVIQPPEITVVDSSDDPARQELLLRIEVRRQELARLRMVFVARQDPMQIVRQAQEATRELEAQSSQLNRIAQDRSQIEEVRDRAVLSNEEVVRKQNELNEQIAEVQRLIQRGEYDLVRLIPGENTRKTPHLIVVSSSHIQVHSLSSPPRNRRWEHPETPRELARLINESNRNSEFFVVMIKPSGIEAGKAIYRELRRQGFEAGFDPLEESMNIVTEGSP